MISKEELEKFTVLQLKEKLKSRKLATSGAKPDLIARLYDNMVAEESLLDMNGVENDSAGISEFDLSNVDVDEVLGMESELLSPTSDKKSTNKLDAEATEEAKSAKKVHVGARTKPLIKAPDVTLSPSKNSTATVRPPIKRSALTEDTDSKTTLTEENTGNGKEAAKNGDGDTIADGRKSSGLSSAEGQKMLLISKKLGLMCKSSDDSSNTEDTLAKRARRFGPISEEIGKKRSRVERFSEVAPVIDEKKQKRTERFGLVSDTLDSNDKKKQRAERFGKTSGEISTPAQDEKLQKRAERFGVAAK